MQAVRKARSVSCPVWRHYMLFEPGASIRFPHWKDFTFTNSSDQETVRVCFTLLLRMSCFQMIFSIKCNMIRTCPCDWNCLVNVVLVVLGGSVQLDPRVLPADWLLAVLILTLLLRPFLKNTQHCRALQHIRHSCGTA